VVTIAALTIAAFTIFMLTGSTGFPWQRVSLKTRFGNVSGLKPGSPVRVAGVEVGAVDDVALVGDQVEVVFQVREDYRRQITTSSRATLGSVSLLGESAVDITPSASGDQIPEWGYVTAGPPPAQLADLTNRAGDGITELTALIHDVRSGKGTIGRLVQDERLYTELQRFVTTAGDLTDSLRKGRGSIGRLLNDPATANALEASLKNIESMTRQINSGQGTLGRLIQDDSFARSLNAATANIDALVAKLNTGEGTAGRLINDPALYNRLNSMSERLDTLVARLNEGEGTAGLLLKDRQLYENMNKVTTDLSALIAAITKDPKRYLNVEISIF
jgi:phospholipid/cholesterol/gamma-HCH transport system substrate-binding protein